MHSTNPSNMSLAQLRRGDGELSDRLAYAGEYHRRKARRAGASKKEWVATGCDRIMTFVDFRQQGRRNKILREYDRPPIYLTGEGQPSPVSKVC